MTSRVLALLFLFTLAAAADAVGSRSLLGTWEAARSPDDERLYVHLKHNGRAEIVAEYDFTLPGVPGKRRGRSTTFGKWSVSGDDVVISYARVRDRLRYSDKLPLNEIGLTGTSAGLKPTGKTDPKSRIRGATLWKAPHEYKRKTSEAAPAAGTTAESGTPGR
jgi:hypothetical protein